MIGVTVTHDEANAPLDEGEAIDAVDPAASPDIGSDAESDSTAGPGR